MSRHSLSELSNLSPVPSPHRRGERWLWHTCTARRALLLLLVLLLALPALAEERDVVTIRLANIPLRSATGVQNQAELAVFDAFFKKYPHYRYERVTGIALPEGLGEAQQMMAFAADRAPDVFDLSIRQVQNYIRQGLLYPLDDLIREHRKRHPHWKPPSLGLTEHHYDAARGPDGKLYAIVSDYWILGLWYDATCLRRRASCPRDRRRTGRSSSSSPSGSPTPKSR